MNEQTNKNLYDVIILGTGPAGLQAAIYIARANLGTLVLGNSENSRLKRAHLISNYFGFPEGVSGKDLLEKGIKQAKNLGAVLKEEDVLDLKKERNLFTVKTNKGIYQGKAILLATGVKSSSSGISGEEKLIGRGISFCVACDGSYFIDMKVAVIGEGDFAAQEALDLLRYTKDIVIYSNEDNFIISNRLRKELEINNISLNKMKVKEFLGEEKLEGLLLENGEKINLDGIFIAKGTPKASDFAYKLGVEIFNDYIKVNDKGKTNIDGIFAAGDVIGKNMQVSWAVGSGSQAAFSIITYLSQQGSKR